MMGITLETALLATPEGWQHLIREFYQFLPAGVLVTEIYDEEGFLKIEACPEEVLKKIKEIESRSMITCVVCGKEGRVTSNGVRCPEHRIK